MSDLEVCEDCKTRSSCDTEDVSGFMCRSYYVCHPQIEKGHLTKEKCLECGKETIVVSISPYCGGVKPTGHYLHVMDDTGDCKAIGVLCDDCLDKLTNTGVLGWAGGGEYFRNEQPLIDIYLEKNWNFKHPENYFPEEEEE